MTHYRIILFLVLALVSINALGHALWIQTSPTGKKGQKQSVTISYSEPNETPEKIGDWYSDVRNFELWLITPDGQKTKLSVTPGRDAYTAEFTPQQDGVYTLAVGHGARDLGGTTKYQFNATATVTVGNVKTAMAASPNELNVVEMQYGKPYTVGKPVTLSGIFKTAPAEKLALTVSSPNGWNRTVTTNDKGVAEFTPLWPGRYLIEASKTEKTSGEQNGKPYQSVWRCATYVLNVTQ